MSDDEINELLDKLLGELRVFADRIERVRALRALRGRDLSPATRAQAERLVLEVGGLLAVLLSGYAKGEG
jgi:hypothetical protein